MFSARDKHALALCALTKPSGENAADRYRMVLQLDPDNATATAGLQSIADRLLEAVWRVPLMRIRGW